MFGPRRGPRELAGALVAITLVALGILGLNLLFGHDDPPLRTDGLGPTVVASPPPGFYPTASPTGPALAPYLSPGPPSGAPSSEPSAEPGPQRAPLTVYNHSRVTHLADKAAEDFTRGGWAVVEVANTRYSVTETTVFFAPGQEGAAAALRTQFPAVRRSAPRPAGLPGSGLTVVVARDYPH